RRGARRDPARGGARDRRVDGRRGEGVVGRARAQAERRAPQGRRDHVGRERARPHDRGRARRSRRGVTADQRQGPFAAPAEGFIVQKSARSSPVSAAPGVRPKDVVPGGNTYGIPSPVVFGSVAGGATTPPSGSFVKPTTSTSARDGPRVSCTAPRTSSPQLA